MSDEVVPASEQEKKPLIATADFESFAFGQGNNTAVTTTTTRRPQRAASLKKRESFVEDDVLFGEDDEPSTASKKRKSVSSATRTRSLMTDGDDGEEDAETNGSTKRKSMSKSLSSIARTPGEIRYWLLKAEPDDLTVEKLKKLDNQTSTWEGVRNFVARNNLRAMKDGDLCLFYQSCVKVPFVPAILKVVKEATPDETQFDKTSCYFDEKSTRVDPRWFLVHVKLERELKVPITRDDMKADDVLRELEMFRLNRLSVSKVSTEQFNKIIELANRQ